VVWHSPKRGDAEGAVEKLKRGAELQWLAGHAEGQWTGMPKGCWPSTEKLLTDVDLPEGVQKVVAGAKTGDYRLYASPEGHFYALAIPRGDVLKATTLRGGPERRSPKKW